MGFGRIRSQKKRRVRHMATRSIIAVSSTVSKKIESIYCHWDGYPKGVGVMLARSYPDIMNAQELIQNGDASSLGFTIGTSKFYKDIKDGEFPSIPYDSVENMLDVYLSDKSGIEFVYLHFGGMWFVGAQYEDLSVDQDNAKLLPIKFGLHKLYSLSDVLYGKGSKPIKRIEELME